MANMWVMFLILGLIVLLALTLLLIYIRYMRDYWKFLEVPHEQPKKMLDIIKTVTGHNEQVLDDQKLEHYKQLYQRFKGSGPFCGYYNMLQPRVLVLEPQLVKQILIRDFSNFNDRGVYHNHRPDPLSGDLYSLNGSCWKEMRVKLEPIFEKYQMQVLYNSLYADSDKLVAAFEATLHRQQQYQPAEDLVEIQQLIRRYVLTCIASNVFGLNEEQQQKYPLDEFEAMADLALHTTRHGDYMNKLLHRYPSLGRKLGFSTTPRKVEEYFLALITDIVHQREANVDSEYHDYLQLIIDIKIQEMNTHDSEVHTNDKELKEHLNNELAAHAFVFLRSGLRNTTNTLMYVLYELALNQQVQQRVREELNEELEKHNNQMSYACVQELKYMQQVILETLRIHPVTPFITRRTLNNYITPNHPKYIIGKDLYIVIPVHAMHNDPANYPEPHLFKPERFSAEARQSRDPCTWLGFSEGPRGCIGAHLAKLQMRIALARLITKYEFSLDMKRLVVNCEDGVALKVARLDKVNAAQEGKFVI